MLGVVEAAGGVGFESAPERRASSPKLALIILVGGDLLLWTNHLTVIWRLGSLTW